MQDVACVQLVFNFDRFGGIGSCENEGDGLYLISEKSKMSQYDVIRTKWGYDAALREVIFLVLIYIQECIILC